jgi:hypothetical protein
VPALAEHVVDRGTPSHAAAAAAAATSCVSFKDNHHPRALCVSFLPKKGKQIFIKKKIKIKMYGKNAENVKPNFKIK